MWSNRVTTNTSPLWKAIQENKGEVLSLLKWQIGDGTRIQATAQPWFDNWRESGTVQGVGEEITVAQLYDHQTNQWRKEQIVTLLGEQAFQQIQQMVRHPTQQPLIQDRYVWKIGRAHV